MMKHAILTVKMVGVTNAQQTFQKMFGWNPIIISISSQNLCRPADRQEETEHEGPWRGWGRSAGEGGCRTGSRAPHSSAIGYRGPQPGVSITPIIQETIRQMIHCWEDQGQLNI